MTGPENQHHRYYWTAISPEDSLHGIPRIESCIQHDGFIIDFHFFSDISISLVVEIQENKLVDLYRHLSAVVRIDEDCPAEESSDEDCTLLLNITFVKNTGDVRHEVPAIPG